MPAVILPRILDPATGGRRHLELAGIDVGTLIGALNEELPGVRGHLFDHTGTLRPHVLCFIDGVASRLDDPEQRVETQMRFVQAVSGG